MKIHYIYPGPDQRLRVVKCKTAAGIDNHPIHELKNKIDAKLSKDFKRLFPNLITSLSVPYFALLFLQNAHCEYFPNVIIFTRVFNFP